MAWKPICNTCDKETKISLFDSIGLVNSQHWAKTNSTKNLSEELEFRYLQFYNKLNEPIGMAVVQIVNLNDNVENHEDVLCHVKESIRKKLLKTIDAKVLVCGSLFSCGENGFSFNDDISNKEGLEILNSGLKRIRDSEKINDNQVSYYLLKEFWPESFENSDAMSKHSFRDFMIDVNMVLPIHKDWNSFDDYLQSMTTKFRTKAKGALKKSNSLEKRNMTFEEIDIHVNDIQKLYDNVTAQSDFNLGNLKGATFVELKKQLQDSFLFLGYFNGDKMVGFCSSFVLPNGSLDANYVGLDYECNRNLAVYQRMLYDLIDVAIERDLNEVRFGRTAEELKSTLGAKPINMQLYIRHRNKLSNQLLKPIISSITPAVFDLRNPFKAEFSFN